jgi:biopolymer transport protein ExbD
MSKKRKQLEDAKVDLTPMIDVVFNLVIFFLIVTDLSKKDIERLTLPDSKVAKQDKADEEDRRLILNIVPDSTADSGFSVKYKGQVYTHQELRLRLRDLARTYEREEGGASKYFVLIRADRDTPWRQVQLIMQDCAQPETMIYRLQFATRDDDPNRTSGGA